MLLPSPVSLRWMTLKSINFSSPTNPLLMMFQSIWLVSLQTIMISPMFSVKPAPAHPYQPYDLKIELEGGTSPPFSLIYSLSQSELKSLQEFLDEHLVMDFIHPSWSPGRALVLFTCKKDGSLWLCIDFHGLNIITKKDHYPLPHISNLLDSPHKAKIYSKIDLQHAYHLVWIHEGDKWKMAFWTHYGSFECHVMPFGLTNAPAAF